MLIWMRLVRAGDRRRQRHRRRHVAVVDAVVLGQHDDVEAAARRPIALIEARRVHLGVRRLRKRRHAQIEADPHHCHAGEGIAVARARSTRRTTTRYRQTGVEHARPSVAGRNVIETASGSNANAAPFSVSTVVPIRAPTTPKPMSTILPFVAAEATRSM